MNQTQQQQQSSSGLMYNAAGQPVVCQTVDTTQPPQAYELYNSHQSKIAGVMLIVVGALAIVLNGIGIGLHEYGTLAGHGFWAGIMFILAGAFGLAAAKKNRCVVITFLVMAVLSACTSSDMFTRSVVGARFGAYYRSNMHFEVGIVSAFMAIVAVVAAAMAIWGSVLGCKVACCGRSTTRTVGGSNQHVVIFTQQPYVSVPQGDPGTVPSAPPTYVSTVGYPGSFGPQQPQQPLALAPDAVGRQPPAVYGSGDMMLPAKQ